MFISILPFLRSRSFTFVEKTSEDADWARNWSSAFYLDVKTSSYIHQTEFYACNHKIISDLSSCYYFEAFVLDDVGELASGLGGFMGIFLGW